MKYVPPLYEHIIILLLKSKYHCRKIRGGEKVGAHKEEMIFKFFIIISSEPESNSEVYRRAHTFGLHIFFNFFLLYLSFQNAITAEESR